MAIKTYTPEKLGEILEKHRKWLYGRDDGVRADLREADLRGADLRGADLREANLREAYLREADLYGAYLREADLREADLRGAYLREADLRGADLRGADLREADLRGADLREADLREANLREAYLREADLREANLRGADLREANLRGAKNLPSIACPEAGSFIGFKKTKHAIVKLEILEDALRSSATSRKCRCSKARVLSITDLATGEALEQDYSWHNNGFIYRTGEIVSVDNFDPNRWNECAPGIHFFITEQEARDYHM